MSRKKVLPKKPTKKISRDPIAWRYGFLTLCCGLVLVAGFFFAARQHFSSIDFSIKNSKLKKQIDELEDAKRNLILEKESAMTSAEIRKAAQKIGLLETTASNSEIVRPTNEKPKTEKSVDTKPKQAVLSKPVDEKPIEKKAEKDEKKKTDIKSEKDKSPVKLAKK